MNTAGFRRNLWRWRTVGIVGIVLLLGFIPWIYLVAQRQTSLPNNEPDINPQSVAPDIDARIGEDVDELKGESLTQSLDNLGSIAMYCWPGVSIDRGADGGIDSPNVGQWDVNTIMSNRRFLKVYQELSGLPKAQAANLVKRSLEKALVEYQEVLNKHMELLKPIWRPDRLYQGGLGYPSPDYPSGNHSFMGMRLQIFGLLLIAANLHLEEVRPLVAEVVALARRQHQEFSDPRKYNPSCGELALILASLYNRQVLGSAVLGTSGNLPQTKAEWVVDKLSRFDDQATIFDLHGRLGVVPVDLDKSGLSLRYLKPLDDKEYEAILAAAKL